MTIYTGSSFFETGLSGRRDLLPSVRVTQAATAEPVGLDEAKVWCRVEHAEDDALITMLVQAARQRFVELTGRSAGRQSLELRIDRFPVGACPIELPFPPVYSVEYVRYFDSNGSLQSYGEGSPTSWLEDFGSEPARIQPFYGSYWPATAPVIGAVKVGYTAGYASVGSPEVACVPPAAKVWMRAVIATLYDKRDQLVMGNVVEIPHAFGVGLLDDLRVKQMFA